MFVGRDVSSYKKSLRPYSCTGVPHVCNIFTVKYHEVVEFDQCPVNARSSVLKMRENYKLSIKCLIIQLSAEKEKSAFSFESISSITVKLYLSTSVHTDVSIIPTIYLLLKCCSLRPSWIFCLQWECLELGQMKNVFSQCFSSYC